MGPAHQSQFEWLFFSWDSSVYVYSDTHLAFEVYVLWNIHCLGLKCYCVYPAYQVAEEKLADLERQSGVLRDRAEFLHQAVTDRCMERDWRIGTKEWANLCPYTLVKKLKRKCFLMRGVQVMLLLDHLVVWVLNLCFLPCTGALEFKEAYVHMRFCHIHNHSKSKGTSSLGK